MPGIKNVVDSGSNWEFLVNIRLQICLSSITPQIQCFFSWLVFEILGGTCSVDSFPSLSCPPFLFLGAAISLTPAQRVGLNTLVYSPSRVCVSPKSSFVSLGREVIPFIGVHHFFLFSFAFPVLSRESLPIPQGPLFPS